jgi:hypothetical protein
MVDAGVTEISPTATVALAVAEVSATLAAATVWLPVCAGAVYRPVAMIVPVVEFPPATPSTDQVTAGFVLFATVAVNCVVAPTTTFAEDWFRDTLTAGAGPGALDELFIPPHPVNAKASAKLRQPQGNFL